MKKLSLEFIAFLQATGIAVYSGSVAYLMWKGEDWFKGTPNYFIATFMITLLAVSALICGFITLGYPAYLFLNEKKPKDALRLIACTCGWGIFYLLLIIAGILNFK